MRLGRLVLLIPLLLSACAGPQLPPAVFVPNARVDSISAEISATLSSREGSGSGSGYLLYRRPESYRLTLLSPFGTTVMEAVSREGNLYLLYPGEGVGFAGKADTLPPASPLQVWKALQAAVEPEPAGETPPAGERKAGGDTLRYSPQGLLQERDLAQGGKLSFGGYRMVGGVPLATEIGYEGEGTRVQLRLREPEVNVPLEEDALKPQLQGLRILPLQEHPQAK